MDIVLSEEVVDKIKGIRLLILDVDGVLTDGSIIYTDDGTEIKAFDVKDGHGIKLLMRTGVNVAIVTARSSKVVKYRAENLGIKHVYQGMLDKVKAYDDIIEKTGLEPRELGYVGDDLVDLPILRRVGFSAAVADAVEEVRNEADFVSLKPGGRGGVREICELIIKVQGMWSEVMSRYRD